MTIVAERTCVKDTVTGRRVRTARGREPPESPRSVIVPPKLRGRVAPVRTAVPQGANLCGLFSCLTTKKNETAKKAFRLWFRFCFSTEAQL